jgi:hypothetical protein
MIKTDYTGTQFYEGPGLVDYPTARNVTSMDARLEVPAQYYSLEDLKGLIKFLKTIKRQMKEPM